MKLTAFDEERLALNASFSEAFFIERDRFFAKHEDINTREAKQRQEEYDAALAAHSPELRAQLEKAERDLDAAHARHRQLTSLVEHAMRARRGEEV
jgi:hypothetical protein